MMKPGESGENIDTTMMPGESRGNIDTTMMPDESERNIDTMMMSSEPVGNIDTMMMPGESEGNVNVMMIPGESRRGNDVMMIPDESGRGNDVMMIPSEFGRGSKLDVLTKVTHCNSSGLRYWLTYQWDVVSAIMTPNGVMTSISSNLFDHIVKCKSTHNIWRTLDQLFNKKDEARLQILENELANTIQFNLFIAEYFLKIKNLRFEISLLNMDESIYEARMRRIIIRGLKPEYIPFVTSIQGWAQQRSLEEFENLLSSQELLVKQLAGEFFKEREGNALVADKRNVKEKARDMPHSRFSGGLSLPEKKEESFNNYTAIKEIKEADPENGNKSLDVEDIEVNSVQTVYETLFAGDEFIAKSIKEDILEVEVSDQSSIVSRSFASSEEILEADEEAKDQIDEGIEIKVTISDGETYNTIEELDRKSSGGYYYGAEASQKIEYQIVIKSNEEDGIDEIFSCYGVSSKRRKGELRSQHHKTQQGQIDDGKSSSLEKERGVGGKLLGFSPRHRSKLRLSSSATSLV
ncbi:hypothetical protein FXO37_10615 [Capsicum annuum]|nr:hypothetical protein FXO37_10615 [Capsicum annuum]